MSIFLTALVATLGYTSALILAPVILVSLIFALYFLVATVMAVIRMVWR